MKFHYLAFLIFLLFNSSSIAQEVFSSYSELKSCFTELAKETDITLTDIPGVVGRAVPYLCSAPPTKISTDFTKQQLEAGVPILADTQNIYVYLTNQGLIYAEFPVFYYIVTYHDASGGYDIGRLPKNYMPIQSSDGKFRVVNGDGLIITFENPISKPVDPRINYSDKYVKLFAAHSLPSVTFKTSSSTINEEQAMKCLLVNAKISLNRISTRHLDYIYSFSFDVDTTNALKFRTTSPEGLQAIKDKYKKTKDEVIDDYASILKNVAPTCATIFTEAEYKDQAIRTLGDFLDKYAREKRYIDGLALNEP